MAAPAWRAGGGGRPLPAHLSQVTSGRRPTDLNERGIASRFMYDIATVLRHAPRAFATMVGAPLSDTVGRAIRAAVPGGSSGFDYGSQTWEQIIKPWAESAGATARRGASVTPGASALLSLVSDEWNPLEQLAQTRQEYSEHPGLSLIEDVGNVSIVGALASIPLKGAARSAAGVQKVTRTPGVKRGQVRAANRAQIDDIARSGGPGSQLAQAAQTTGDLIGHPYRVAGRGLIDLKLPKVGALHGAGEAARNHSIREVISQVRASTPADRMDVTPDMKAAADLRRLRAEHEHLLADPNTPPDALAKAAEDLRVFEQQHAGRLDVLEHTRLAPTPLEDLTSPMAQAIRRGLDTERASKLTQPLVRARRETRAMVHGFKEQSTDAALDAFTVRNPIARRRLAVRQLRDLDKELRKVGEKDLATYGIELPPRGQRFDDAALFEALTKAAETPELRSRLPRMEPTLDITLIDLYERMHKLPEGAIRNQLYDDLTLTPEVADVLRSLQRLADDGVAPASREGAALRAKVGDDVILGRWADQGGLASMAEDPAFAGAMRDIIREQGARTQQPLYRGIEFPDHPDHLGAGGVPEGFTDLLGDVRPGQVVDLPPSSFSLDEATAATFAGEFGRTVELRPGARVLSLGDDTRGASRLDFSAERELLSSGRFRVASVDGDRIVLEAVGDLPPVPAGHTRLYRGADGTARPSDAIDGGTLGEFRGRYFTPDEAYARRFAEESGGDLTYVDVPTGTLAAIRNADTPEATYMAMKEATEGSSEFILPQELVDTARPVRATALPDDLPQSVRQAIDEALGQAYRLPEEQLANPLSAHPRIAGAYRRAMEQLTSEAAARDVTLAKYGLGDPERWALRATRVDGEWRPMAPGDQPQLTLSPSRQQARTLKSLGRRVAGARSRLEGVRERAAKANVEGRRNAYDDYRAAARDQRRAAVAWDRARRAGDQALAASLRVQLDRARQRAQKAKVEARKDIYTSTQSAARAIESVVESMARQELPVGVAKQLTSDLKGLLRDLDSLFVEADVAPRASLRRALEKIDEANIDLGATDAHHLDNLLRLGVEAPGDTAAWQSAVEGARAAARHSKQTRGRVGATENLIRAEERARAAQKDLAAVERRLANVEGRLEAVDVDALDAARVRVADAEALARDIAIRAGMTSGAATPAARRALEDRLLKAQVQARLREAEVNRAVRAMERAEAAFDAAEAQMRQSIDAAPAVARPILQVSRSLEGVDGALRQAGLEHVANDLNLTGLPQTLEAMEKAGVSPTFLRRMEERLAGHGDRAAAEQPVKTPTMSAQRRRTMSDIEVRRDIDRVKAETDIELAGRVLAGEMADNFERRFGRSADQIAETLIEEGRLNRDAWRNMTKHQREKLLGDLGYNTYNPEQIFSFKVRRTSPDDVWIPKYLNTALIAYQRKGPFERLLTDVVGPATVVWKHAILALRPAWHVYNIVGSAAMATLAGGVPLRAYLEFMRPGSEAHTIMRRHRLGYAMDEFGLTPELAHELMDSGLSRDLAPNQRVRAKLSEAMTSQEAVQRFMESRAGQVGGQIRQGVGTVISESYRLNAFFDNLNRTTVYLDAVQNRRMSPAEAVRHANQTIGNYTKMTPTEKVYLRSVFPFYAWMRHITQLSAGMLHPNNINRAAMLGTITHTLGEPSGDEALFPDYMSGDLMIPGTDVAVGMRGMNPWQDVLDTIIYNDQISTRGLARSMHPIIQFIQERQTGIDTLTGRPFSRPVPVLDDLGREIPTAPSIGEHAFQKFAPPQAHLLRNIGRKARGETTARYSTGDPVLIEGTREPNLLGGLGGFFGAPLRFPDLEGIEARRTSAVDRVSRQLERYRLEVEEYEEQRRRRSLPEKLVPFGD